MPFKWLSTWLVAQQALKTNTICFFLKSKASTHKKGASPAIRVPHIFTLSKKLQFWYNLIQHRKG